MSGKHTPGPWEATTNVHGDLRRVRAGACLVAVVIHGDEQEDCTERDANTRLIAAAPDLLAAAIAANHSGAKTASGKASISSEAFNALAEAIWKATAA